VLCALLGNGESFKQRGYSSQLAIPFHLTGKDRGSRRTDWSLRCSENTSVFTSSSSSSAEPHVCSQLLNLHLFQTYSAHPVHLHRHGCGEGVGTWEGKCSSTGRGTRTHDVLLNRNKKLTPCRSVTSRDSAVLWECSSILKLIRKLGFYLLAEIERNFFKLICPCLVFMDRLIPS